MISISCLLHELKYKFKHFPVYLNAESVTLSNFNDIKSKKSFLNM